MEVDRRVSDAVVRTLRLLMSPLPTLGPGGLKVPTTLSKSHFP